MKCHRITSLKELAKKIIEVHELDTLSAIQA